MPVLLIWKSLWTLHVEICEKMYGWTLHAKQKEIWFICAIHCSDVAKSNVTLKDHEWLWDCVNWMGYLLVMTLTFCLQFSLLLNTLFYKFATKVQISLMYCMESYHQCTCNTGSHCDIEKALHKPWANVCVWVKSCFWKCNHSQYICFS